MHGSKTIHLLITNFLLIGVELELKMAALLLTVLLLLLLLLLRGGEAAVMVARVHKLSHVFGSV